MASGFVHSRLAGATASLEWGVASYKPADEPECGDLHVIRLDDGGALVAVIDGAGHGAKAASVSRLAAAAVETYAGYGIIGLVRRCHEHLKGTRGVVISLASFSYQSNEMTWLGVGNVQSLLFRGGGLDREVIPLRGGVLGYKLPALKAAVLPVERGDLLVLATDGIQPDFAESVNVREAPQKIADRICGRYAKQSDDGLVLAIRYLGLES